MAEEGRKDSDREDQTGDDYKVSDRRLFDPDGELRRDLSEAQSAETEPGRGEPEADDPVDNPASEPARPEGDLGFEHRPSGEPSGELDYFKMLVGSLEIQARIDLGQVAHPGTGKTEINIEQAQIQIDLLDMLRTKCRGNLSADEERLVERVLYELRMLFVARSGETTKSE